MPKKENLFSQEAVEKIKKIADDIRTTIFCTNLGAKPFSAAPMATQKVEDDGAIWFFSTKDSDRNQDLKRDGATQLIWSSDSEQEYLSLYGHAEVLYDRAKAEELWSPEVKIWFQDGPTDPNLSLIKFIPADGYYWDTQHGKIVSLAKMAASLVIGKTMDDSVDGKLKI